MFRVHDIYLFKDIIVMPTNEALVEMSWINVTTKHDRLFLACEFGVRRRLRNIIEKIRQQRWYEVFDGDGRLLFYVQFKSMDVIVKDYDPS